MTQESMWLTAVETADAVRAGDRSARSLVAEALDRVDHLDRRLHAFCRVDRDESMARASVVDSRLADGWEGPLAGVPTAFKDLHPERGKPLCSASLAVTQPVQEADSPAIAALRSSGLVSIGATASPEFGTLSVTESPRHGITLNPWDVDRICGGSSGGAAVAVASGMVPIAHGSDGAGSIREPAGYCGLVGMKPSRGRVPSYAVGWASEGVLTRTVADTAAALDVFSGAPACSWYKQPEMESNFLDASRRDPPPLKIAVSVKPAFAVDVEPRARRVTKQVADLLADLGHEVVELDIPGLEAEKLQHPFEIYWSSISADYDVVDETALEPLNQYLRERARYTDTLTFAAAQGALVQAAAPMYELWRGVDVLLTPTTAREAPPVGELRHGSSDPLGVLRKVLELAAMTMPANLLGLPGISIPVVDHDAGVPLGTQLIGGPQRDAIVLSLAGQLERVRPWRHRRPPSREIA